MRQEDFIVSKGSDPSRVFETIKRASETMDLIITVKQKRKRRSEEQNRLLWSLYGDILRMGGEAMRGWTAEDIHELMLGEHFGWTEMRIGKHRRKKPVRRSSGLTTIEFSDFVDFIVRYMAEQGVVLHLPGDLP
jgi:NinB protein